MEMLVNSKATVKQVFTEADHSSVVYQLSKERGPCWRVVSGHVRSPGLSPASSREKKEGRAVMEAKKKAPHSVVLEGYC